MNHPSPCLTLKPMTRQQMHDMYRDFTFDPDIFMDMSLMREYRYDPAKVDALYHKRAAEEDSLLFAILLGDEILGEVGLRHIDREKGQCELSIHMKNDSVKNRGYGTEAEKQAVEYAFTVLGMEKVVADSVLKNVRSQHVLEKVGFRFVCEKDIFRYYELHKDHWRK